ncbi:LysR family transcriptional regulator [Sphingobium sp. LB126]|uniref:LysR family transcriptional regulator n=1 Tax=Sphingobium sp. LB126 TaxID=1983755 RepID=UPI00000B477D|nr:LysR family transcriptional regulator [Sphingobium sp. LB126]PJG46244.1 LysR family transcriptional regulator [Sphingobium sp. LB126]CAB87565.1 FldY protein [Sphingobium sp. LB126]
MSADQLNIRHLAAMAAVVERGSVSLGARAVNLTQPAVTQGIAKLEAQLGLPLFERQPGGMVPTEAALVLAPRVDAALRLIGSKRVTAAQIRAFVTLARTGSYPAAAAEAGVTEPSLHRAVGDLGLAMGYRLADRRGRGLVLTRQGAALARRLRLALAELRSGLEDIADIRGQESGRIVIGAMPLSRARLLPAAIAGFRADFPQVDISVHEGSHAELVAPLRDGEVDMMIGALRDPSIGQDLVQKPLFEDRPIIIGRAGHPLADGWLPDDLRRFPWILPPEGAPLRQLWRRMFDALDIEPPPVPIECGSVMTIRQLLLGGDYLTLLSVDQLALELKVGVVIEIGSAPGSVSRTIGITTRADWRPTRLQSRFLDAVEKESRNIYS